MKPYSANFSIWSKIPTATAFGMPLPVAPETNLSRCCPMIEAFFFEMAFLNTSASDIVMPPSRFAMAMTCSW